MTNRSATTRAQRHVFHKMLVSLPESVQVAWSDACDSTLPGTLDQIGCVGLGFSRLASRIFGPCRAASSANRFPKASAAAMSPPFTDTPAALLQAPPPAPQASSVLTLAVPDGSLLVGSPETLSAHRQAQTTPGVIYCLPIFKSTLIFDVDRLAGPRGPHTWALRNMVGCFAFTIFEVVRPLGAPGAGVTPRSTKPSRF